MMDTNWELVAELELTKDDGLAFARGNALFDYYSNGGK